MRCSLQISPFLMADEWGKVTKQLGETAIDPGPPSKSGERHVGWHPHRGFDIISYIKEGRGRHADSLGNQEIVRPGGLQFMRTGSGVEHAEGGGNPEGAPKHGFQLWVNLPASQKMDDPTYGTVQPEDVPVEKGSGGAVLRRLAGVGGACFTERGDMQIVDVELPTGTNFTHLLPTGFTNIVAYVYQGEGRVAGRTLRPQMAALLTPAEMVTTSHGVFFEASRESQGLGVMLFSGKPIDEPIEWQGPIVMNTRDEIQEAYRELEEGGFLRKRAQYDYRAAADASSR